MKTHRGILAVAVFAAGSTLANAQVTNPVTGTVNAQLVLTSGCEIESGAGGTTTDFGTLNFGTRPAYFTGSLNTGTSGSGSVGTTQVTCSPDLTSVNVTVDGGRNANKGTANGSGSRAMTNGTDFVPYEVYSDSGDTNQYVAGTQVAVPIPTPGQPFDLPIYGVANKTTAAALSTGTYTDTLNVTLGW